MNHQMKCLVAAVGSLLLAILLLFFWVDYALGYPENVRLGYTGCGSCHVSPTGGGALTNYGRSTAEEISSWSREGTGRLLGTASLPDWLAVGGDARYLYTKAGEYSTHFPMQRDLELAAKLDKVWVDVSAGYYGPKSERQVRRAYALWAPSESASLRVGKFTPAYGIMVPDHTVVTRGALGFGEGTETCNVEAAVRGKAGELVATVLAGVNEKYQGSSEDTGATVRGTLYAGDRATVGASGAYRRSYGVDTLTYGGFATAGVTRNVYLLGELDYQATSDNAHKLVNYTMLGAEVVRGLHLRGTHESTFDYDGPASHKVGVDVQWLPVAHWELLTKSDYDVASKLWAYTALLHYYW